MKKLTILSICAGLLLTAQHAFATYIEVGDSGDSIATAQAIGGSDTDILGSGGSGDVDMYSFSWGGGGLYIDSFGAFTFDTQLFLFDSAGFGVLGNDDHGGACSTSTPGSGLQSCLDLTAGLAAGSYVIGISSFNNDPLDGASTAMMSCSGFSSQCTSSGGSLAGWTGGSTTPRSSAYTITLTSTTPSTLVPEPGVLMLLAMGLMGLGFAHRRGWK